MGEYLKRNSCGAVLEKDNYVQWTKLFSDFIDNNDLKICNQVEVHKILNWTYCANKFLDSFKTVLDDFYQKV